MGETGEETVTRRWKTIRIFISSTFKDMQAERDALNNITFPALTEKLKDRRCRIEPVDLRIGVRAEGTSEEEREQSILRVCLAEIDRTRPFLLVLLGDRYGWTPGEDRIRRATEQVGFETVTKDRSVTSLEIEYGLLKKSEEQRRRSAVFLREPLPYKEMGEYAAVYSDEFDPEPGSKQRFAHLQALKEKLGSDEEIRPHLHTYKLGWDAKNNEPTGAEAWALEVEKVLWKQIDEETAAFAREPDPTWQQQERFNLEEFIERLHGSFAGREPLVREATEFLLKDASQGQAWCVAAESGAGKSALFAAVYESVRGQAERLPLEERPVVLAESGSISPRAGRLYWTLRRWIGELSAALGLSEEPTEELKVPELEEKFFELLGYSALKRRIILMTDALNQFERTDRVVTLKWLPEILPANVRLFATAIPGEETKKFESRKGWKVSSLPAFSAEEIGQVARRVYAHYHREPVPQLVQALEAKVRDDGQPAAGNALWLTLALDLLNLLDADDFAEAERDTGPGGNQEKLDRMVMRRCEAFPPSVEGLYQLFLDQVEKAAGQVMTRCVASVLALSRGGWREEDLEPLFGAAAKVLFPDIEDPKWDGLQFAIFRRFFRAHLVERGEFRQLDFAHSSLRGAIRDLLAGSDPAHSWRPGESDPLPEIYSKVADVLEGELHESPCRPNEMMWHMLGTRDQARWLSYYALPTSGSGKLAEFLVEEQRSGKSNQLEFIQIALALGASVQSLAEVANKFNFDLFNALDERDGWALQRPIVELARGTYERLGRSDPTSQRYARGLSVSYTKLGDIYKSQGQGDKALGFYQQGLEIAKELRDRDPDSADYARDLSVSYTKLGDIYKGRGQGDKARGFYQQGLEMAKKLQGLNPNSADCAHLLSISYDRLGDISKGRGNGDQAREFYQQGLEIRKELRDRNPTSADYARALSVSYERLGDISLSQGQVDQALEFYEKSLEIVKEVHVRNPNSAYFARALSISYDRLGDISLSQGHGDQARGFYQQGLEIRKELRDRNQNSADYAQLLSISYERLGDISLSQGRRDQAREFFEQGLEIRKDLCDRNPNSADYARDLSVSYERLGDISLSQGQSDQALKFYEKGFEIRKELRDRDPNSADFARVLSVSYNKLGDIFKSKGQDDQALEFYQQGLEIAKDLRNRNPNSADCVDLLSISYDRLGDISKGRGQGDQALGFYQQGLEIRKELRDRNPNSADFARGIWVSYHKLGDIYSSQGQDDQALEFYQQGLEIAKELSDRNPDSADYARDLSVSYERLGDIFLSQGLGDQALEFYQQGLEIVKELRVRNPNSADYAWGLSVSYNRLGDVYKGQGQGYQALEFYQQSLEIRKELRDRNPNSADYARGLSVSYHRLAQLASYEGQDPNPWHWECREVLRWMVREGMTLDSQASGLYTQVEKMRLAEPPSQLSRPSIKVTSTSPRAEGLEHYRNRAWGAATGAFEESLAKNPNDPEVKGYLAECIVTKCREDDWDEARLERRLKQLQDLGLADVAADVQARLADQPAPTKKWWHLWNR